MSIFDNMQLLQSQLRDTGQKKGRQQLLFHYVGPLKIQKNTAYFKIMKENVNKMWL